VAAFQDITSLYEVDRLKSEFVSIVSPRAPHAADVDQGRAGSFSSTGASHRIPITPMLLTVALSNTERLVADHHDILDISKIEAGKLELNARPHAVDEV